MSPLYWPRGGALRRAGRENIPVQISLRAFRVNKLNILMQNPVQPATSDPIDANFILGVTKPDASNTGYRAGTRFTSQYTGEMIISKDNTVLENMRITGRVLIRAKNVTIRNCEIIGVWPESRTSGSGGVIDCVHSTCVNARIERCTIHNSVPSIPLGAGIIGHDFTAVRNHIYEITDYFGAYNTNDPNKQGPNNVIIEGNYGHDMSFISPDPGQSDNRTHNDGIQIQGGTGTIIRGNHLVAMASDTFGSGGKQDVPAPNPYHPHWGSVIVFTPNVSQVSNVIIEKNWIYGGFRGIGVAQNKFPVNDVGIIRNNIFGRDRARYSLGGIYGTKDIVYQNGMSANGNATANNTLFEDVNGNIYEDGLPIIIQFRSTV